MPGIQETICFERTSDANNTSDSEYSFFPGSPSPVHSRTPTALATTGHAAHSLLAAALSLSHSRHGFLALRTGCVLEVLAGAGPVFSECPSLDLQLGGHQRNGGDRRVLDDMIRTALGGSPKSLRRSKVHLGPLFPPSTRELTLRHAVVIPVRRGTDVQGCLVVAHGLHGYGPREMELLQAVGDLAGAFMSLREWTAAEDGMLSALRSMLVIATRHRGQESVKAMVRHLAACLDTDCVTSITSRDDGPPPGMWVSNRGRPADWSGPVALPVPLESLEEEGTVEIQDGFSRLFPELGEVVTGNPRRFLAVSLLNPLGEMTGFVALTDGATGDFRPGARELLRLASLQISIELDSFRSTQGLRRLAALVTGPGDLIALLDGRLRPIHVTPTGRELLEIPDDDPALPGDLEHWIHLPADDVQELQDRLGRSQSWSGRGRAARGRPGSFPLSLVFEPLPDIAGMPAGFALRGRRADPDITTPALAEPLTGTVAGIGKLVLSLTDDINNLLFRATGYTDLLLEGSTSQELPDASRNLAEKIKTACDEMVRFSRKIAAFSVLRHEVRNGGRPLDEQVRSFIDGVLPDILSSLRQNPACMSIETSLSCRGQVPSPDRVDRLLRILVENAVESMAPGGHLKIGTWSDGAWSFLEVRDTGVGMQSDELSSCFTPGAGTRKGRGRGLGLYLARLLLVQLGGSLTLSSVPGEGTTALVRLPFLASN